MKKTLAALLASAGLAGIALPACAETFKNEVSASGSWEDIDEPTDFEQTHLFLRNGRFMSPQFVATAGLLHSRFKGPAIEAATTGLTIGAKYYISELRAKALHLAAAHAAQDAPLVVLAALNHACILSPA